MSATTLTSRTWAGGLLFAAACIVFIVLNLKGTSLNMQAIPATIGWAAALFTMAPMIGEDKKSSMYFAFGVMAFLIFFLHETYEYHGSVRTFPLIVGWTGIVLSVLDILSITDTRIGRGIATFFGSQLAPPEEGHPPARRELACFAAMGGSLLLIWLVGFLIASPLFVFLWMVLWGRKKILLSIYVSIFTFIFIWGLFDLLLNYELYPGLLIDWVNNTYFY